MAAYRRVYGFSHLWADCRGLGSAPEPMLILSMELPFTFPYSPYYHVGNPICLRQTEWWGTRPNCRMEFRHYERQKPDALQGSLRGVTGEYF